MDYNTFSCVVQFLYYNDICNINKTNKYYKLLILKNKKKLYELCSHIQPHGSTIILTNHGSILRSTHYKDGSIHGVFKEFFNTGEIKNEINYYYGIIHGFKTNWYHNGMLQDKCSYNNGIKQGVSRTWM